MAGELTSLPPSPSPTSKSLSPLLPPGPREQPPKWVSWLWAPCLSQGTCHLSHLANDTSDKHPLGAFSRTADGTQRDGLERPCPREPESGWQTDSWTMATAELEAQRGCERLQDTSDLQMWGQRRFSRESDTSM